MDLTRINKVKERLQKENLCRVTADFDGTVQNTKRHAEGTAVGFNKVKKGNRSYYPLLCLLFYKMRIKQT